MTQNHLRFFDTTLRDGEQSPGCSMTQPEKLAMAHALEDLGVDILEAGFAISSEGDFSAIRSIASEIRLPIITSLARARREDIERAAEALEPAHKARIHLFLASSDIHLEYKLKISREQALAQTAEAVAHARSYVDDVEFSPEDATRTSHDFLCQMVAVAIEAGATTINLPDTVGYSVPAEYAAMFRVVRERVPGADKVILSTHCHNDLGLAVANTLAAVEAGARQVECSINGIGERAGNAALEEIAAALRVRADQFPVEHNLNLERIYATSQQLTRTISFGPAPNKAIVGANAFAHEAGIHQHGVLSNPLTYEIMTPASVGVPANRMVLGKHSGRHALRSRLVELGYTLQPSDLDVAYRAFTELADRKKSIYDQDLINLVAHHQRHEDLIAAEPLTETH
ncbi:2-isopropylmalate synthase [Acidipila rosea]|uniref:2-isopropylmalate synthase n=1 Tax=Acidipila rosea TaxID=768535 RepID=A0A4R1LAG1_9BACT|nr:2-isopropylmalate synthase [Acidipila rosea]MBW4026980.1 2-isopropylmalate synthase [Acidobacteriota bacterium]MBW4045048.1 2-isopropylmalate synthase [Acidobacteriota bacterium]TCK75282.1 2-isopropylmalate synthase [Acidipila rosea]